MCSLIFPLLKPIPSLVSLKEKSVWAGAAKAVDPCQFTPRAGSGRLFVFLIFSYFFGLGAALWGAVGGGGLCQPGSREAASLRGAERRANPAARAGCFHLRGENMQENNTCCSLGFTSCCGSLGVVLIPYFEAFL